MRPAFGIAVAAIPLAVAATVSAPAAEPSDPARGSPDGGASADTGRPLAVYADGAPPGHTGGFGEPTCTSCHFDAAAGEEGRVRVQGFPEVWTPGRSYLLHVLVTSPEMARGGFQLAVRAAEGEVIGGQAGRLEPVGPGVQVRDSAGVGYAGHAEPREAREGGASWTVRWVAPVAPGSAVILHVAANAANGDDSEFGDAVYTDSLTAAGPPRAESAAAHGGRGRETAGDDADAG